MFTERSSMRLLVSRNHAVENGERDRPGRTGRRLADWKKTIWKSLSGDSFVGGQVFGETPNTATETGALANLIASLRLRRTRRLAAALVLLALLAPLRWSSMLRA